ncbi:PIG-L family deacetylase [Spirillospora sp. NPDC047279]|uniref:PIG-L deacetylase family protein n=1 Tax=Spirillospora sp. NPDC047279 TaxID=3155478 RepID=UPI0033CBD2BE
MNWIDAPGTAESEWRAWSGLAALPALDLAGLRDVVVVAAHPDDEVLGVGGLLAMLDVPVRLVAVTDGEGSHPHLPAEQITATRRAESEAALAALGSRARCEVVRLGMPDAGVRDEELIPALKDLTRGFDLCLAPWEHDAHRDHEAAGRSALAAGAANGVEALRFPIWAWHWATPADPRLPWAAARRVSLTAEAAARKRVAIGCFTSQLGEILPPGIVDHFTRDQEVLFR